ncbi:MAG: UDP-N-acetyl-D-mannosaminuronic acid dehydrogenase [Methanomicrobiales archaeon 53_19]|uniref:nucleotide sugar dehydrogenase n=1 Tax=Methanocalculus sp. TaxID=2004547 RepID=UPI000749A3B4|nr:nucleotide sugar dehydrogenase [Methanocalculus sp.]KUK69193.1 MAG: UDP-N-acetyl-D-mannosaminuronic acid dehydrogenase [Methanocalculus sp. 52_23]KUL02266.1 MAG: UDP-N-acetyl-D-mannosaminuronic acid dehydrogenase [Methanomicrobiales archaeon 53_19]HIJ06504.1 nucleotide sugar dehydrogenase [Methanocalculus sp.]
MTDHHQENHQNQLTTLINNRGPIKTIGVIGMGYVGIPAAALFADAPEFQKVYGFQRDSKRSGYKIGMINRGESPLDKDEPELAELIEKVVSAGKFECTADFSKIAKCDAVCLAIQTPFADPKDLIPDFRPLQDGLRQTGRYLTEGTLVVLESTITPGTTTGMVKEILEEESGLVAGKDFALAHAPERVMVGRLLRNIREHDRIVGGIDDPSTRRAIELYTPVLKTGRIIPMTATAAEVTKTAENAFRDLQIAAANQLALHCEAMGVNVYDVRAGIDSLKGEGITRAILWPGAGVGGHCLTKDTWHLERGAQQLGGELWYPHGQHSIFGVARAINDFMPSHMAQLTRDALERAGKDVAGSHIALLGWAFINDSGDARNTPSEPFYEEMERCGARMMVHDPFVAADEASIPIESDLNAVLRAADAIVIFTGHSEYKHLDPLITRTLLGADHPVIVDGRNVIDPDSFISAGFIYKGIGRGDKNNHTVV